MLTDRELFSAKVALEGRPREAFPVVARGLLASGHDGPAIRQLAALEGADSWMNGPVLDDALKELGAPRISKRLAALRLAQDAAKSMLSTVEPPFPCFPSMLYRLWIASDYIDDLDFVDNYDPHWSVYFENESAAKRALNLALERIAVLDLREGEPTPPPPRPSFRSLITPVEEAASAAGPSVVPSASARLTFRERWQAARQQDKSLLLWTAVFGIFVTGYWYCRAVGGPRFKQFDMAFGPLLWLTFLCSRWVGDAKLRRVVSKGWMDLRSGETTSRRPWRALMKRWRGFMLR